MSKNMKKTMQLFLLTLLMMVSGTAAMAQSNTNGKLSREDLAVKQAQYIAKELALDEATTKKYVETYCQYQREKWAIGSQKGLSTTQRLERSQQILDLRKKYNATYLTFLTEAQLEQAYRLEKRLMDRMKQKKTKGNGNRTPRKCNLKVSSKCGCR